MFEAKFRGRLVRADGVTAWTNHQVISAVTGGTEDEKHDALNELLVNGVLKRDPSGVVYSSRLVRDEELRQIRKNSGSKGGSKTQAKRKAKLKQIPEDEDEDEDEDEGERNYTVPELLNKPELLDLFDRWVIVRESKHADYLDDIQAENVMLELHRHGLTGAMACLSAAISSGWKSISHWRPDRGKLANQANSPNGNGKLEPFPEWGEA